MRTRRDGGDEVIAGLLLAAGRSRRFGGDKLLATLRGRRVIRWSAEALSTGVDEIYAVIPPGAHELVRALGGLRLVLVEHVGRDNGLSSSIAAGVSALAPEVEAVVVGLADQPFLSASAVRHVVAAWRRSGSRAVAPQYRDGRGHPVLFDRRCFHELSTLTGDAGARAVLDAMGGDLLLVPVDDPGPSDVDTPEALAKLEAWS